MRETLELMTLLIAPAMFWAAYHYYKDRHQPEPVRNLLLTYGLGIAAGYLGLRAYEVLEFIGLRHDAYALAESSRWGLLVYAVGVIGLVEETVKFIPFWLIGTRLHHFDEPIDGIIYASFVALGFATYENFYYLPALDGLEAIGRAVVSPVVHVAFASVWGYACSRAQIEGRSLWPAAGRALLLAAVLHGAYDFVAIGVTEWVRVVPPLIVLGLWWWRLRVFQHLHDRAKADSSGSSRFS